MKTKLLLLTICLFITAAADAGAAMPFHPYRKVGDKYFNLQPIYEWLKLQNIPRNKLTKAQLNSQRPMPAWIGESSTLFEYDHYFYKVEEVMKTGLVIARQSTNPRSTEYKIFLLLNYPFEDKVAVQESISFLALKTGVRDVSSYGRIEVFDYGVPYNPLELAREREKPNAPAARTNAPTKNHE